MNALLVDAYGVLLTPRSETADERIVRAGISLDTYRQLRPCLEAGAMAEETFWRRLMATSTQQVDLDVDLVQLAAEDIEADLGSPLPRAAEFQSILETNTAVGVVANSSVTAAEELRLRYGWLNVDAVVFSCDIGVCLPDPQIFQVAVDALGVYARDTVYVSGSTQNRAVAEACGLQAVDVEKLTSLRELVAGNG